MGHLISVRQPDLVKKTQKTFQIVNFAVPVDHRVKLKEIKKKDTYQDLDSELKKNCGT